MKFVSSLQINAIFLMVALVIIALAQRWWGVYLDNYFKGLYAGGLATYLIMQIKQRRLEQTIKEQQAALSMFQQADTKKFEEKQ
jgi:hypothetical protein